MSPKERRMIAAPSSLLGGAVFCGSGGLTPSWKGIASVPPGCAASVVAKRGSTSLPLPLGGVTACLTPADCLALSSFKSTFFCAATRFTAVVKPVFFSFPTCSPADRSASAIVARDHWFASPATMSSHRLLTVSSMGDLELQVE